RQVIAAVRPALRQLDFVIPLNHFAARRKDDRRVIKSSFLAIDRSDDGIDSRFTACRGYFGFSIRELLDGQIGNDSLEITSQRALRKYNNACTSASTVADGTTKA